MLAVEAPTGRLKRFRRDVDAHNVGAASGDEQGVEAGPTAVVEDALTRRAVLTKPHVHELFAGAIGGIEPVVPCNSLVLFGRRRAETFSPIVKRRLTDLAFGFGVVHLIDRITEPSAKSRVSTRRLPSASTTTSDAPDGEPNRTVKEASTGRSPKG